MNVHQETLALRLHFKEILKTLHEQNLEKLPWYLILGPEKSGKTALASHSCYQWLHTIPPFFTMQSSQTHFNTPHLLHPVCARINRDGVFIEIPGRYLQEKMLKRSLFSAFLQLLKKNKINHLVRGIILVVGLDDLSNLFTPQQQEQIYVLKQWLTETAQIIKQPINLQILLSKTDTLMGFNEFFSEALQEERADVFGIEFPGQPFSATRSASQAFSNQFTLLLTKLNERVISLLHRERLIRKKALIADFPHQLAAFKDLLNRYIYDLFDIAPYQNKILLRSIYFCSNFQNGEEIDHLAKLLNVYDLPCRTYSTETLKPKSYFVNQLLKKASGLSEAAQMTYRQAFAVPRSIGITAVFSLMLISLIYLGFDFHQKTQVLRQLQKELATHRQIISSNDGTQILLNEVQTLSSLQKIIFLLKNMPLSSLMTFTWHPLHQLSLQTQQNYQQLLEHQLIPLLQNSLTRELINASVANPNHIYSTLKAYLALGDPKKHRDYLTNWLKNYLFSEKLKGINPATLNVQEIDFNAWPALELDNPAIAHAQSILTHLPKPLLAYFILKGEIIGTVDPFPADFDKVFIYPGVREIPAIYTREKIANVYFDQIPEAARAAFSGNDVLGKEFFIEVNTHDFNSIVEQVREFYLQDYARQWQNILTYTQIKLANDFSDELNILDALSKKPSPLTLLLQKVTEQTALDISALSEKRSLLEQRNFYNHFKDHFSVDDATSRLLVAKPHLINQVIQPEIIKLKKILENISRSANAKKAAFDIVKAEYQNQKMFGKLAKAAFEMPQPLSRWLISLISNDWLLLLEATHSYINQAWLNSVVSEYRSKLSERYPLVKQSTNDVELADFAHFFGQDGTLDIFARQYLLPFIDTNKPRWQWRELYGQSLSKENDLPLQLERAALIRKMFFSKSGELSVEFYLMPMSLGPMLKGIHLNIDGQQVNNQTPNSNSIPFVWPGGKNREGSSLTFVRQNGERVLLAERGCWSLFRLLEDAYVQPLQDSKHYAVTFDLNGNAAKYQLATENAINPFVPNFIAGFKCLDGF